MSNGSTAKGQPSMLLDKFLHAEEYLRGFDAYPNSPDAYRGIID
jgi:hypothetical protein